MKTTFIFVLSSLLIFTACTPGDPQVLSEQDRLARQSRKPRNEEKSNPSVKIPEKVEIPMGALIEARQAQALQILKKARQLVRSGAEIAREGCVQTELLEKSDSVRRFKVLFFNCVSEQNAMEIEYNGQGLLEIQLSTPQEISRILYKTPSLKEKSPDTLVYLSAENSQVAIEDAMDLEMTQNKPGEFEINKFNAESILQIGEGANSTLYTLQMTTSSGSFVMKENSQVESRLMSKIQAEARNTKSELVSFSLKMEKKIDSPNFSFEKSFGKGRPRTGQLNFSDEAITLVPYKGPVVTVAKQKAATQFDGQLPWGFWF